MFALNIKMVIASLFLTGGVGKAWAAEDTSQQAHVHGRAELTVILEHNLLQIGLVSPAANIVGFESHARTREQITIVERTVSILESVQKLFVFEGTDCRVQKTDVDLSVVEPKHEHAHGYGEQEKDTNDDDHEHGEIVAEYEFRCQEGGSLNGISFEFLDQFKDIERLRVMWITDREQRTQTLSGTARRIDLR